MADVLRVGVIGAGAIARGAHLVNYQKCGERVEVAAVADTVKETAGVCKEVFDPPGFHPL